LTKVATKIFKKKDKSKKKNRKGNKNEKQGKNSVSSKKVKGKKANDQVQNNNINTKGKNVNTPAQNSHNNSAPPQTQKPLQVASIVNKSVSKSAALTNKIGEPRFFEKQAEKPVAKNQYVPSEQPEAKQVDAQQVQPQQHAPQTKKTAAIPKKQESRAKTSPQKYPWLSKDQKKKKREKRCKKQCNPCRKLYPYAKIILESIKESIPKEAKSLKNPIDTLPSPKKNSAGKKSDNKSTTNPAATNNKPPTQKIITNQKPVNPQRPAVAQPPAQQKTTAIPPAATHPIAPEQATSPHPVSPASPLQGVQPQRAIAGVNNDVSNTAQTVQKAAPTSGSGAMDLSSFLKGNKVDKVEAAYMRGRF